MDLEKVKKAIEKRYKQRQVMVERRRRSLYGKIKTNAPKFLNEFPSVTQIVLFGSLIKPGYFTVVSDVDIAVKGLRNADYWKAFSFFEKCLKFENIDLVRIEEAKPAILKYIEKGEIVYEKKI